MKKILISAAIITGLIAPALFAATQYTSFATQKNTTTQSDAGGTGTGKINSTTQNCMRTVMSQYAVEKSKITEAYKENVKSLLKKNASVTVSGEKMTRPKKLKSIQKEYTISLEKLKNTYLSKQRNCTKK